MTQAFTHVHNLNDVKKRHPTFVAIGSFDGVHLGHQALLQEMVTAAQLAQARTAVLTFFPHPKRVVQKVSGRYYITTLQDRVTLLAKQGIDLVITHPFNNTVRQTRAADFVEQLCHHLEMRELWGGNFALGYNREGDVPFLRHLGQEKGYTVTLAHKMVMWQERLVNSSRIRQGLADGDIKDVSGCLGRPYHLTGTVIEGAKLGRTIGFPTANLLLWEEQLLPAHGVYATYAWVDNVRYIAATNVGLRPTVDGQRLTVEAHLLNFDEDLYGRPLNLQFLARIRPEQKFDGLDTLKHQIQQDVIAVKQQLTHWQKHLKKANPQADYLSGEDETS